LNSFLSILFFLFIQPVNAQTMSPEQYGEWATKLGRPNGAASEVTALENIIRAEPFRTYFTSERFLSSEVCPAFAQAAQPERVSIAARALAQLLVLEYWHARARQFESPSVIITWPYALPQPISVRRTYGANCSYQVPLMDDMRRCFVSILYSDGTGSHGSSGQSNQQLDASNFHPLTSMPTRDAYYFSTRQGQGQYLARDLASADFCKTDSNSETQPPISGETKARPSTR
jgi:hypothetical protein